MRYLVGFCLCVFLGAGSAAAATLTVNAGGDLQAAIDAAQPGRHDPPRRGRGVHRQLHPADQGRVVVHHDPLGGRGRLLPRSRHPHRPVVCRRARQGALDTERARVQDRRRRGLLAAAVPRDPAERLDQRRQPAGARRHGSVADHAERRCLTTWSWTGATSTAIPPTRSGAAIALNSGDTQIINSYISDIKGEWLDTQAIAGWNGPGPFLIENNHIEAAAENIMFGGSDPAIVEPRALQHHDPPQPHHQADRLDVEGLDRQESDRAEERRHGPDRRQHHREQLGRRAAGLLDRAHAAQPGEHRAVDGRAEHHRAAQRHPARRRRCSTSSATTTTPPAGRPPTSSSATT